MAITMTDYYNQRKNKVTSELLLKRASDLQNLFEQLNARLEDISAKKSINNEELINKINDISLKTGEKIGDTNEKGQLSAQTSAVLGEIKGLSGSGSAKRNADIALAKAKVDAERTARTAHREKSNLEKINILKNRELSSQELAHRLDAQRQSRGIENQYTQNYEKLINDIMLEQQKYAATTLRNAENAKLKELEAQKKKEQEAEMKKAQSK